SGGGHGPLAVGARPNGAVSPAVRTNPPTTPVAVGRRGVGAHSAREREGERKSAPPLVTIASWRSRPSLKRGSHSIGERIWPRTDVTRRVKRCPWPPGHKNFNSAPPLGWRSGGFRAVVTASISETS